MKIKGYISNLNIERSMQDVYSFGSVAVESIPSVTTAKAEIIFTEGDLSLLFNLMHNLDPIEIDVPENGAKVGDNKPKKKNKWRMIRLDDA